MLVDCTDHEYVFLVTISKQYNLISIYIIPLQYARYHVIIKDLKNIAGYVWAISKHLPFYKGN